MIKYVLLFLLPLYSGISMAEPELKGSPSELSGYLQSMPSIINVTGSAEIKANADKAIVTIVVRTENETLSAAIKANELVRQKMFSLLTKYGIKKESIQNSKFSSTPEYSFFADKPESYKVSNAVLLTITSEKEFFYISKVVDRFQEVFLTRTVYEHSKQDKYKKVVLEKAINSALDKKAFYEKSLGLELSVENITENTTQVTHQAEEVKSKSVTSRYSTTSRVNFGALTYLSNVKIKYRVIDK